MRKATKIIGKVVWYFFDGIIKGIIILLTVGGAAILCKKYEEKEEKKEPCIFKELINETVKELLEEEAAQ